MTEPRWLYERRDLEEARRDLALRFHEELRRRTRVVRTFPNAESCLRLLRALAVEIHEEWAEGTRYLNMDLWAEHKKEQLRLAEAA